MIQWQVMQPNSPLPRKQVMDITVPPRQAAPAMPQGTDSQALPVHAAPVVTDEEQSKLDSRDDSIDQEAEMDVPPVDEMPQQQKKTQPAPVVAITLAVFAMLGLSAIAIMIYLNS